jgi:hypothetical protein
MLILFLSSGSRNSAVRLTTSYGLDYRRFYLLHSVHTSLGAQSASTLIDLEDPLPGVKVAGT